MKCLILTALGFACAALATPTPPLPPSQTDDLYQITDYYIFNVTIEEFIKTRELEPQPAAGTLDWTADGCSSSPDDPFGFDFSQACLRHDFAYRNYRLQKHCTGAYKKAIDKNFKKDMYNQCGHETSAVKSACESMADIYYVGVKFFGGNAFCNGDWDFRGVMMGEEEAKAFVGEVVVADLE